MEHNGLMQLDNLARGAMAERFDLDLKAVLKNILDPNTKATAKRTITLKLTMMPNEDRTTATVSIDGAPTLAPAVPVTTTLLLGRDIDGTVVATEISRHKETPGQLDMDGGVFIPRSENLKFLDA